MSDTQVITEVTDYGKHNENLAASASRIIENGTWKKQRVVVIIPAGNSIPSKVVFSWMQLIFPPNQAVYRHEARPPVYMALGTEVGDAFSTAIEQILAHPELSQWEYILTLEHDNVPPPDGVVKLIASMEKHPEFACIGGLYWTKGPGGVPQIWGDPKDPVLNFRPQPPDISGGLVECCGTGMGFNLWRTSLFRDKKLRKPWFKTVCGVEGSGTQDLYFWGDARKNGYRCAIDCSVKVGHYDPQGDMTW